MPYPMVKERGHQLPNDPIEQFGERGDVHSPKMVAILVPTDMATIWPRRLRDTKGSRNLGEKVPTPNQMSLRPRTRNLEYHLDIVNRPGGVGAKFHEGNKDLEDWLEGTGRMVLPYYD